LFWPLYAIYQNNKIPLPEYRLERGGVATDPQLSYMAPSFLPKISTSLDAFLLPRQKGSWPWLQDYEYNEKYPGFQQEGSGLVLLHQRLGPQMELAQGKPI
jgi:hypothetical protein